MNLCDQTLHTLMDLLFPPGQGANDSIDHAKQIQPSTVDLRLGNVFWVLKMASDQDEIDPRKSDPKSFFTKVVVEPGKPFRMLPNAHNLVLGQTMEYVSIPNDMVGFVDGRSSYGRWGLRIHSTAGLIDAGFKGIITLEMALDNRWPMVLWPGDRICQIRFEQLDGIAVRPYGAPSRNSKYVGQSEATLSLLRKDHE